MTVRDDRYETVVRELESRGVMPDRTPSLEPMREALRRLGYGREFGHDPARVIVVAGTNGKGSVCAALEALLLDAGASVGLYTSPHLVETTERIRLNGRDVTRENFCRAFEAVEWARGADLRLTHFEMLTAMAVWAFSSGAAVPRVEWMILEVGLGGTWDATNAVPHHWNGIASLGHDHQNLLGNTLPEIAANKFGIIHEGSCVVHSRLPEEVTELAREVRDRTRSRWREASLCTWDVKETGPDEPRFMLGTPWGEFENALAGARGAQNAGTALSLFEELGFDPGRHASALARVRWAGRMQRLEVAEAPCPVYLSGDHNPQGVQSLLELLPHYRRHRLHVLVGVGRDKDYEGVLGPLSEIQESSLYLTVTPFKGRELADYGETWLRTACGAWAHPQEAFREVLKQAAPGDMILVTGSLYLVGAILQETLKFR